MTSAIGLLLRPAPKHPPDQHAEHDRDRDERRAEQPQRAVENRLRLHPRVERRAARRAGGRRAAAPRPGCCRAWTSRRRVVIRRSCSAGADGTRRSRCRSSRRRRRRSPRRRADRLPDRRTSRRRARTDTSTTRTARASRSWRMSATSSRTWTNRRPLRRDWLTRMTCVTGVVKYRAHRVAIDARRRAACRTSCRAARSAPQSSC